jgi:hypothetical protein
MDWRGPRIILKSEVKIQWQIPSRCGYIPGFFSVTDNSSSECDGGHCTLM